MPDTVVKIENLSKEYRLGVISHRTLYRDLQSFISRVLKKEDPNSKVGIDYSRVRRGVFHALDDVSLDIKQGDVVGIIGKNGAGKSTLLKILSRVTGPTRGEIKVKGKIASLLEVGTGFHPELTGKENIYLNGAILGMRRYEIAKKFDEIVAFSGIDEFIDTPVKRYSSGMYVRLAFAVAAHLEPDILIVDEVLAVGDAEFRKKCLGKMNEVSKTGRTILFVSHEMSAVTSLCNRGVLLENGKISFLGNIEEAVNQYTNKIARLSTSISWELDKCPGNDTIRLWSVRLIDTQFRPLQKVKLNQEFGVEVAYEILRDGVRINPGVTIYSSGGQVILISMPESKTLKESKGLYKGYCWIRDTSLNTDIYSLRINAHTFYPTHIHFDLMDILHFEVFESDVEKRQIDYKDKLVGALRAKMQWEITRE